MADNYYLAKGYQTLEMRKDIEDEIMTQLLIDTADDDCIECAMRARDTQIIYVYSEENRCIKCGKIMKNQLQLQIIDNWLSISKCNSKNFHW